METSGERQGGFTVFVDDNFRYQDDDARYELRTFGDPESAVAACMRLVDEFLEENRRPGMSADDLLGCYKSFGPDPFVVSSGEDVTFSAWDYAERRCSEIC